MGLWQYLGEFSPRTIALSAQGHPFRLIQHVAPDVNQQSEPQLYKPRYLGKRFARKVSPTINFYAPRDASGRQVIKVGFHIG